MKRTTVLGAIGLGALTSLPIMALSYLGETAGLPFPPFDFFDWLARTLPGDVITTGIDLMVDAIRAMDIGPTSSVAKPLEQLSALMLFIAIGGGFGLALGLVYRSSPSRLTASGIRGGLLLFAGLWMVSAYLGVADAPVLLSGLWLALLMMAWGWGLAWMIKHAGPALSNVHMMAGELAAAGEREPGNLGEPGREAGRSEPADAAPAIQDPSELTRREFVRIAGGSIAGLTVGSWAVARLFRTVEANAPPPQVLQTIDPSIPVEAPSAAELAARLMPAPGTRPELTSNDDFYRIDINTRKPQVDAESWRLELGGLVNSPLSLTIEELMGMPSISYYHTLSCISNRIGGDLISTTLWTGVPIMQVLEMAGMRSSAEELRIDSSDGFFESVPMRDLMNPHTILAYAMNGQTLPHDHGYPLRIIIPGHYGMKQPKWIESMEVIDHEGHGYWVDRGWSAEAFVRTTSVIDTVAAEAYDEASGTIPIGGIGYAGANGISRVEIQVDDGPWTEAQLRSPARGPYTWVQWRYDWPRASGRHDFRVRAYDGNGNLQLADAAPVRPDGATGIHEVSENV